MSEPGAKSRKPSQKARKSASRLWAVKALYQVRYQDQEAESVLREFQTYRIDQEIEGECRLVPPQIDLFAAIVRGVKDHQDNLVELVGSCLNERNFQGLEYILQSCLLAGAYELWAHHDIPVPIIIDDYVHVTHAYFDQGEARLVNAVLDRLAATLRA